MAEHVNPTRESFARFRETRRAGPVHMLNLIRLKPQADYEDGRPATGAEAYSTYGRESGPIFRALGGRIIWSGRPEVMVIGPDSGEDWDIAFIAEYPSEDAFVAMIRDPDYQKVTYHRTAAIADSRLIRMEPLPAPEGFSA
ncbi:MAG: DUF1330 domain-containing protein [Rhodobacteraceae bacterium]|nr:DUF1330 domain-containing protein [Paracoccaceae bacterium]